MFRFVHTGDIHIGLKNHGLLDPITRENSRIHDVLKCVDFMIDYLIKEGIDYLFIAGDVFHSKFPGIFEQVEFVKRLQRLNESKIHTHILLGNHDVSSLNHKLAALHIPTQLKLEYIHIYRSHGTYTDDKFSALFLGPYVLQDEAREFIRAFLQDNTYDTKLLFCHPLIDGCEYSSGVEAETVEESWDKKLFEEFPELSYVGMGHVHKHQVITQKPLSMYCGSISRCDFSEEEDKGFLDVTLWKNRVKYELIQTPTRDFVKYKGTQEDLLQPTTDIKDKIVRLQLTLQPGELLKAKELKYNYRDSFNVVFEVTRENNLVQSANLNTKVFSRNVKLKSALEEYFNTDSEKEELIKLAGELQLIQ